MKPRTTILTALAFFTAGTLAAEALDLGAYLGQVRSTNEQLKAARSLDAAYALQAKEPLTAYSPQLKAQVQRYEDKAEPTLALLSPDRTVALGYGLGLSKFFSTGTFVDLGYESDHSILDFPPSMLVPATVDNYGHKLKLTLNQSLWRNFMASELEAGIAAAAAGADASRAGNRYGAQSLLFQARAAYVSLATLRQVLAIQTESLARNQKILEWTKRKYADNLADKVDVLQVEAALRQVALALAQSQEEEAKAVARFNALRGASPTAEVGELQALQLPSALPVAKNSRQDLVAAEAALRASDALVEGVVQRFTPDVSVFAVLAANDRDKDFGQAAGDLGGLYHGTSTVGVKLTANLDLPLYRQVLDGAKQAQGSGQARIKDKQLEIAQDWQQLKTAWDTMQKRLALASELEALQKEKAEREKTRYQDGRTTNFQVLRFEDDYNLSRIQTLQLTAQANVLEAQARFYNGDDQPW
jgi:outer membrane protein TolC